MTFELHETIRDALLCGMVFLYKYKLVSLTLYLLLGSLSSFLRLTHECPGCPNLKPKRQSNEDCDDDETKDHRAELLQSLPPVAMGDGCARTREIRSPVQTSRMRHESGRSEANLCDEYTLR